ncbi:hypothetical protein ARAM_001750 [Aspergillus rambellii]|uniref:Chitobiosyldiphosphodolichol beta-mannosyltransferase n=2 Tax=Aspergillus subgen. Nidulantes TaxID=2720870 RepID=A0A0F8WRC7_9EURO|nr:hypothetical protein AOCH_004023 [Aspergillus ochraceoroseus]KKK20195.1 hypothetical protein ARAM_001750 [Aspergillus rambellii]
MIESVVEVAFYISTAVTVFIFMLPSQYQPQRPSSKDVSDEPKTTAQVLVLGDIGRSPRMQYHALSIARGGESEVHPEISSHPRISIVPLPPHPSYLQTSNKILFLLFGPLKVLFQMVSLWWVLAYRTKPAKWLLVQNPPSIPTLAIASLVCFFRQTRLIIDWHNFGYTILALKLGGSHLLVRLSKWYEKVFCKYASAHFCVTKAMASVLKNEFALSMPILPLHDRPASDFQPILNVEEREKFLLSLPETAPVRHLIKDGNLKVIVSSTSWTPDEDFSLLIDALCQYSKLASTTKLDLPQILAIITGKGPQRDMYVELISELQKAGKLKKVTICTAWLSTSDYARLLASASLGVSLHTSSSGVDLPMKVVDMFGSGLPVVGWDRFEAWPELVTEGVNGRGFGSSNELAEQLVDLLGNPNKLEKLRTGARNASAHRWEDEWNPVAGKLLGLL